jgi:hypothetical protein
MTGSFVESASAFLRLMTEKTELDPDGLGLALRVMQAVWS